jgi:hypothetical protein
MNLIEGTVLRNICRKAAEYASKPAEEQCANFACAATTFAQTAYFGMQYTCAAFQHISLLAPAAYSTPAIILPCVVGGLHFYFGYYAFAYARALDKVDSEAQIPENLIKKNRYLLAHNELTNLRFNSRIETRASLNCKASEFRGYGYGLLLMPLLALAVGTDTIQEKTNGIRDSFFLPPTPK